MSDLNLSFERKHLWIGGLSFLLLFGFAAGLDSSQDGGFNLNES